MAKIKCGNCGAEFEEALPKCPYCNAIYEPGAEREYMEDLGELKEDLSELSEVPEDTYKRELSKNVKRIIVILLIAFIIVLAAVGIQTAYEKWMLRGSSNVDTREQLLWEKENFPQFDEWYEEGNYDALAEAQEQAIIDGYSVWNWEHAYFINAYNGYSTCMERREILADKEKANENTVKFILNEVMYQLFFVDSVLYSDEDWEIIQSWRPELEEILYVDLKFTEEEAQELYEKMNDDGIMNYKECDKYAKKIWKRCIE